MSERDAAQRKADIEWLYRNEPSAEERTRAMDEAEAAELRKRAAGRPFGDPSPASPRTPAAAPRTSADSPRTPAGAAWSPAAGPRTPADGPRSPVVASASRAPGVWDAPSHRPPPAPPIVPPAPPGPAGGHGGRRRPPRPATIAKRVLAGVAALLVVALAWLLGVPAYAWSSMTQVAAFPTGSRPASQPGTAILLVGSDARQGLTAAERNKLGTGWDLGARTDTMMILYVPPSGSSVLLSLPRDSYVPIPGHGHNKLNAAFSIGGPQLLMRTVEQDTGIRMDGYLEVGMGGFADVIDSLNGIRMCLPQPMKDQDSHTNLPAGCQTLNGTNALGYVRMRKADPLGDLGRVKRQREMIAAVAKKVESPGMLLNPVKYWDFAMASRNSMRRAGVGLFSLPGVAKGFMDLASGKGQQLTVPVSDPNAMTPAGSSVLWDQQRAKELFAKIARGDTAGLDKLAK